MSKVYQRQSRARKDLETVWEHPRQVSVIHYSCEGFLNRPHGRSPRITSIAVRNLETAQTKSFSIHKFGELNGLDPSQLKSHYDKLEKETLDRFFELAKKREEYKWLHWNMRDENYGFHALEMRYEILNKKPCPYIINDQNKFDLSRILIGIYGKDYIGDPRLEKVMEKNEISNLNFKPGEEEASLFDQGKYVELHQSTLRKVDVLSNICEMAYDGNLKTNANWLSVHGHSIKAFMSWFSTHPYIVFAITISSIVGNIFQFLNK